MPFKKGQSGNPAGKPLGSKNKSTIVSQKTLDDDMRRLGPKVVAKFKGLLNKKDLPPAQLVKILMYISDYNKDAAETKEIIDALTKKVKALEKETKSDGGKSPSTINQKAGFSLTAVK